MKLLKKDEAFQKKSMQKPFEKELRRVWHDMISRCTNKKKEHWKNYGGRGIKVYEDWKEFDNFYEHAVKLYVSGLTMDRIDNDGNYEPGNIRWITRSEQNLNTRRSLKNRISQLEQLNKPEWIIQKLALWFLEKIKID